MTSRAFAGSGFIVLATPAGTEPAPHQVCPWYESHPGWCPPDLSIAKATFAGLGNPMTSTLVMTVIGPDRTGLVDDLARTVAAHGGNWQESRMCHLGGRFAGLMRVVVPAEQVELLQTALASLGATGLTVVAQDAADMPARAGETRATVELVGQDRPGLLREVTRVLAQHQLNIEDLTSERADAPFEGGTVFKARAMISAPASTDLAAVAHELELIAADLLVDIRLDRGDRP